MKIEVDRSRCAGHARCNAVAPQLYKLDDEGYIATASFEVPAGMEKLAHNGARACPERVIRTVGYPDGADWQPAR
jgi:ferredoxin